MKRISISFILPTLILVFSFIFVAVQIAESSSGKVGSLFWGNGPSTGQPWTGEDIQTLLRKEPQDIVSKRIGRFFSLAKEGKNAQISPVEKLEFEGIVFSDPRYKKSQEAIKDFSLLLAWAISGAFEGGVLGRASTQRAQEGIRAWIGTCRPDGNPINQNHLIPLFCAIDVAQARMTPADQARTREWLGQALSLGDKQFESKKSTATVVVNNHRTWHLAIRGMMTRMIGDEKETRKTRDLLDSHVMKNLNTDGTSYDFYQRDALHYHIYNLEAYIIYLMFSGKDLSTEGQDRILRALEFLKPYFLGERKHLEFVKTTVRFDITRKEADDRSFQNKPWEPHRARKLFRLSRALFKERNEFLDWTRTVLDENHDPLVKLLAALHGGE